MLSSTLFVLSLITASNLVQAQGGFRFGPSPEGFNGGSSMKVSGSSGVSAMQLAVTTENTVVFVDRIENNPLKSGKTPFWAAEMTISNESLRGLKLKTNSFCAGGAFNVRPRRPILHNVTAKVLSQKDGTLLSIGGDANSGYGGTSGMQAIRAFKPCDNKSCQFTESATLMRRRWYPATIRLPNGSIWISGGVSDSVKMIPENNYEFYPRSGNNVVNSQFLKDALKWNLFPHAHVLPSGSIFVAANRKSMILDWKTGKETRLPDLKMIVTYPFGSASALLPLKSSDGYLASVLFCGGGAAPDNQYVSSQQNAFNQCARMDMDAAGLKRGWAYEAAPDYRIMGNLVIMPQGKLILLNGAATGMQGYYDKPQSGTGYSAADHPRLVPYLYDPDQPAGQRWSELKTSARVNRMYHSVASLLPDGRILTSGSNPNAAVQSSGPYPTEYRNEYLSPAYMSQSRPSMSGTPNSIGYSGKYSFKLSIPSSLKGNSIIVSIHDLGYSTHAVDYNRRMVVLDHQLSGDTITISGPPNSAIYPPGPAFIFVSVDGVPTTAKKVMVG